MLPASQPFRAYLVDLMEPHKYPELRAGITGPTKRPYDVAGWTLSMTMGVAADRVEEPFVADLENAAELSHVARLDHRENAAFRATAALVERNIRVRWNADGEILVDGQAPAERFDKAAWELRRPRVAVYEPWVASMDAGWTQWVLDTYQVPHALLRNDEIQRGDLGSRFDAVILASQNAQSILHGTRAGEPSGRGRFRSEALSLQRPEYTGGIGVQGLWQLENFVRQGGTLIAFDAATELPVQFFPLPVRSLLRSSSAEPGGAAAETSATGYYCPGSLLRIQVESAHPLALGMPKEAIAFSDGGQAWDIALADEYNKGERELRSVARYASSNLLASGWISGERAVLGKHILIEARHGKGRVVLFGFRPQFRGQTFGTFKFLLNAIYLASARAL